MTKKKFFIGCLATIGAIVVIVGAVAVATAILNKPETEEPPAVTEAPAETETTAVEEPEKGEQPPLPVEIELIEATIEGVIEVTAFGAGSLESLNLFITSHSDDPLQVAILPGTVFESPLGSVQSMVVTVEGVVSVKPGEEVGPLSIDAASIDMELDVAGEDDSLVLSMSRARGALMKLLDLANFGNESLRLRQLAVWTITDNPARSEYAGISAFGIGSGPTDEEIDRIQSLFDEAGISPEDYWVLQKPVYVELVDAKSRGFIEVNVSGDNSIDRVRMSLTSKSEDALEVAILPGTIFAAQAAGVQSMMVIVERLFMLHPGETVGPVTVTAACANMQLDVPSEGDTLALSVTPPPEDLLKLLQLPDFHEESFRVRQFAIWTITDNPGRNEYVGIGYFGMGTGPNDEEIAKIKTLFDKAGISIYKYRALR